MDMDKYLVIEDDVITNIIVGKIFDNSVLVDETNFDAEVGDKFVNGKVIKQKDNMNYRDKRVIEYGDLGAQLGEIYDDMEAWRNRIAKIKEKYPKT